MDTPTPLKKSLEELNLLPTEHHSVSSDSLTPEEIAEVIRQAEIKKIAEIRRKGYWQEIRTTRTQKPLTAEEIIEDIIELHAEDGSPFVVDDSNRDILNTLALYFAGDPKFETMGENYSLSKGILLYGGVGIGKTYLMKHFCNMQRMPFRMIDCTDVAGLYKKDGESGIERFFTDTKIQDVNYWNHQTKGWCFDDLGVETDSRYFGQQANVMERILEVRYRSREKVVTHIITNLIPSAIEQKYGVRIRERMREMFNTIVWNASESRRK